MANNFKRYASRDVGTVAATVGSYTVAANTQTTAIGLTLANISNSAITVTAMHNDGANDTHIVKDATLPAGGALIVIGGNQKLVMETGDSIKVSASANTSVDAILSVLEIT
jgi:hypothetical protein